MDLKDGLRQCIKMSTKFSLLHGTGNGLGFEETIRLNWNEPDQLRN